MFGEYVFGNSPASYANLIWINDVDYLNRITSYSDVFEQHGFDVIEYRDDLSLRIGYEQKIKAGNEKLVVLNFNKAYIPYDIMKQFALYTVSLRTLFSKLNADVLHHKSRIDLDLLAMVAANNFDDLTKPEQTNQFFDTVVYGRDNLLLYFRLKLYDEWGERTTLYHSIDKLISTLKELNVLSSDRPGKYKIVKHAVQNNRVSVFMIYAMMLIGDSGYYSFADLSNAVFFYPFEYQIEKELILGDSRFSTNNFGGELSVSVNV